MTRRDDVKEALQHRGKIRPAVPHYAGAEAAADRNGER